MTSLERSYFRRERGSRICLAATAVAACLAALPAQALPTGPQVVAGSAQWQQTGQVLDIRNAPGTILHWQSFSIGARETVRFQQQSSLSSVLNRVTGRGVSEIHGALLSNGQVWLINPNGILFGPTGHIDVHGLIASSLAIGNDDFLAGRMRFTAADAGTIRNAGVMNGTGNIYLVAPEIENSGIIRSSGGEVLLAAGREVNLVDGAHPDIQVVVSAPQDRALNLGELIAGRISVFGALVQQRGSANADRAELDDRGRIVFRGSRETSIDGGLISATHAKGVGGHIEVLGPHVSVTGSARLDASGAGGGGTILVGGDFQGDNPAIPNALTTNFGPDATLAANGGVHGNGGKVIVWADETTHAFGQIEARGGSTSGHGGFVEVSGKRDLLYRARTDTRAPGGKAGTLLLDPTDMYIVSSLPQTGTAAIFHAGSYQGVGDTNYILNSDLQNQLALGNVWISTNSPYQGAGNIHVDAPVQWGIDTSLQLTADGSVAISAPINAARGGVYIFATGNVSAGSDLAAAILNIQSSHGNIGGTGTLQGLNKINLTAHNGINANVITPSLVARTDSGDISIRGHSAQNPAMLTVQAKSTDGGVSVSNYGHLFIPVASEFEHSIFSGGPSGIGLTAYSPLSISGSVTATHGAATLTASEGGTLTVDGVVAATGGITAYGGSLIGNGTLNGLSTQAFAASANFINNAPPPPTLQQCIGNPALKGCDQVLPSFDACLVTPMREGCSVVLPSLDTCIANPAVAGCTVVLPSLATCIAAPATPGCATILPTFDTCIAAPATPGCSAVLPTISACIANPATAGCAVVLPSLATCISTPAAAGCAVVLPSLATCTVDPGVPGCAVVLPSLSACIANPAATGCPAVLPTLSSCLALPATPGCSVVLPSLATCIGNPAVSGCSLVLPSLAICIASPGTAGCPVVLPSLTDCVAIPATPGCSAVLPSASDCADNPAAPGCSVVVAPTSPETTVALQQVVVANGLLGVDGASAVLSPGGGDDGNDPLPMGANKDRQATSGKHKENKDDAPTHRFCN